ncbi:hypothetical protein [Okeania hirsuta]|nr:hypothetical protein [Okeania hirsuta]
MASEDQEGFKQASFEERLKGYEQSENALIIKMGVVKASRIKQKHKP